MERQRSSLVPTGEVISDLRHAALEVPVAGKHRFLQLERFRIEAPRFSECLVDACHYRLGPTSRS